jgi:hypothetical protein
MVKRGFVRRVSCPSHEASVENPRLEFLRCPLSDCRVRHWCLVDISLVDVAWSEARGTEVVWAEGGE